AAEWQQRQRMASRRRALTSSVLRELREELGEGPLEVGEGISGLPPPPGDRQRQRLEEALLQRLGRGRRGAGPAAGGGALATITHFRDIGALLEPPNQEAPPPKRRKKPMRGRKRKGRGRRR
ncbi:unnamed protein product, partial [Bubo scandiacus]